MKTTLKTRALALLLTLVMLLSIFPLPTISAEERVATREITEYSELDIRYEWPIINGTQYKLYAKVSSGRTSYFTSLSPDGYSYATLSNLHTGSEINVSNIFLVSDTGDYRVMSNTSIRIEDSAVETKDVQIPYLPAGINEKSEVDSRGIHLFVKDSTGNAIENATVRVFYTFNNTQLLMQSTEFKDGNYPVKLYGNYSYIIKVSAAGYIMTSFSSDAIRGNEHTVTMQPVSTVKFDYNSDGGTVTQGENIVESNDTVELTGVTSTDTFVVTPKEDYKLQKLYFNNQENGTFIANGKEKLTLVYDKNVNAVTGPGDVYRVPIIGTENSVKLEFEKYQYRVKFDVNNWGLGTITYGDGKELSSENPEIVVPISEELSGITVKANENYYIKSLKIDGVEKIDENEKCTEKTLDPINDGATVTVEFAAMTYSVTFSTNEHGTVTADGYTIDENGYCKAEYKTLLKYTVTAVDNYHISGIEVDGVAIDKEWGNGDKIFNGEILVNKPDGHTIEIEYAMNAYEIRVTIPGENGEVVCDDKSYQNGDVIQVNGDQQLAIEFVPWNGTVLYEATLDSASILEEIGEDGIWHLDAVDRNMVLTVVFKEHESVVVDTPADEAAKGVSGSFTIRYFDLDGKEINHLRAIKSEKTYYIVLPKNTKIVFAPVGENRSIEANYTNWQNGLTYPAEDVYFLGNEDITNLRSKAVWEFATVNVGHNGWWPWTDNGENGTFKSHDMPLVFVSDAVPPALSLTGENNLYCNAETTLRITYNANDAENLAEKSVSSGLSRMTYWITDPNQQKITLPGMENKTIGELWFTGKPTSLENQTLTLGNVLEGQEDGTYSLYINVYDNAGNECASVKKDLTYSTFVPEISVEFGGTQPVSQPVQGDAVKTEAWFSERTATVKVVDPYFNKVGMNELLKEKGLLDPDAENVDWIKSETEENVHSLKISFADGYHNELSDPTVDYTNLAGNKATAISIPEGEITSFHVDGTPPVVRLQQQENDPWDTILDAITFGLFHKDVSSKVKVSIEEDHLAQLHAIHFTKAELESLNLLEEEALANWLSNYPEDEGWQDHTQAWMTRTEGTQWLELLGAESDNEAYVVAARVRDLAGNTVIVSTDGIVLDSLRPGLSINAVEAESNGETVYNIQIKYWDVLASTEPSEEATEPGEEATEPSEEATEPGEEPTEPGEEATEPSEEATEPTEMTEPEKKTSSAQDDITRSGVCSVVYWLRYQGKEIDKTTVAVEDLNGEPIDISIKAGDYPNADVTICAKAIDRAGNEGDVKSCTLNTHPASAEITLKESGAEEEKESIYYKAPVAELLITDEKGGFRSENAKVFLKTPNDQDGSEIGNIQWISQEDSEEDSYLCMMSFEGAEYAEGEYTLSVSYTPHGTEEEIAEQEVKFVVDRTEPEAKISLEEAELQRLLRSISFDTITNRSLTPVATVSDKHSPITSVRYYVDIKDSETELVPMTKDELAKLKWTDVSISETKEESVYKLGEKLDKDISFVIYLRVEDAAGNYLMIDSKGVKIDKTAPEKPGITLSESSTEDVLIYDINAADIVNEFTETGISSIYYRLTRPTKSGKVAVLQQETISCDAEGKAQIKIPKNEETNYSDMTLEVTVTDGAGNESTNSVPVDIDITPPKVEVTYNDQEIADSCFNGCYFKVSRTATVTVTERDVHFDPEKVNWIIQAEDLNENKIEDPSVVMSKWTKTFGEEENGDGDQHVITLTFNGDAHYIFDVEVTDNAGNLNDDVSIPEGGKDFYVDRSAPKVELSVEETVWSELLQPITFGLFKQNKVKVTVKITEDVSHIESVSYCVVSNETTELSLEELQEDYDWNDCTQFVVGEAFELCTLEDPGAYTVYATVNNKAGWSTTRNTDGVVYDNDGPDVTIETIPLDENGNELQTVNGKDVFKGDVKLKITATDATSGIQLVQITLPGQEEKPIELFTSTVTGTTGNWTVKETRYGSRGSTTEQFDYTALAERREVVCEYIIKARDANVNNYLIEVVAKDRLGKECTKTEDVSIDTDAPEVTLSYDQVSPLDMNLGDPANGYYRGARTLVLTVEERAKNFDHKKVTMEVLQSQYNGEATDYEALQMALKNESNWTSEGNNHVFRFAFSEDGRYSLVMPENGPMIRVEDAAGNVNETVKLADGTEHATAFVVDNTAPMANVSMQGKIWNNVLSVLTFGLFSKEAVPVTAEVNDATSELHAVEYFVYNGETALTADELLSPSRAWNKWQGDLSRLTYAEVFDLLTLTEEQRNTVYLRVTDKAMNRCVVGTDGLILDATAPKEDANALLIQNKKEIYNGDVTLDIRVSDVMVDNGCSGIQSIRLQLTNLDDIHAEKKLVELFRYELIRNEKDEVTEIYIKDLCKGTSSVPVENAPAYDRLVHEWDGSYTVLAREFNCNTLVELFVTDMAGNVLTKTMEDGTAAEQPVASLELDIDTTAPRIEVAFDQTQKAVRVEGAAYFNQSRTATVRIYERPDHLDLSKLKTNIVAKNYAGELLEKAVPVIDLKNYVYKAAEAPVDGSASAKPDNGYYAFKMEFLYNGNYELLDVADYAGAVGLAITDEAGNRSGAVAYSEADHYRRFTVDYDDPTEQDGKPTGSISVKDTGWDAFLSVITFGFFDSELLTATAESMKDEISPLDPESVYYLITNGDIINGQPPTVEELLQENWTKCENLTKENIYREIGVCQIPECSHVVYLRFQDYAGNMTVINTDGTVVDYTKPVVTLTPPVADGTHIYNSDVAIQIHVEDPGKTPEGSVNASFSGIATVDYFVQFPGSAEWVAPANSNLFTFTYDKLTEDQNHPLREQLVQTVNRTVTLDEDTYNYNGFQFKVVAKDNSGHVSEAVIPLNIDKTLPRIVVDFDNDSAMNSSYFRAQRIATITVTERNFDPAKFSYQTTSSDSTAPRIGEWTLVTDGTAQNHDDRTYRTQIVFSDDSNYTFPLSACTVTDKAGNQDAGAVFASGTVAGERFTVDKTAPVLTVTYDNNAAENKMYYKENRTATITVTERNFREELVRVSLSAKQEGKTVTAPRMSAWSNNGSMHTATVEFSFDAEFSFDISVQDLAGNAAADYAQDRFVVDTVAPVLQISGVKHESANSGIVAPEVSYSDLYLNGEKTDIKLIGASRGEVDHEIKTEEIEHGFHLSYKDFPNEKEMDDVYSLQAVITDLAGNVTEQLVTFSVNRFGSTYEIDPATQELNGTYVQEAPDVVLYEINPNKLSDIRVEIYRNDETVTLVEGEDYEIILEGGEGEWYRYTYRIFSKNFEEDGSYRIAVHSKDEAGNVAENSLDTKNMDVKFGVDKTKPTISSGNLKNGKTYPVEILNVIMLANDNLVLEHVSVSLDGAEYVAWNAKEIQQVLSGTGEFNFDISAFSNDAHDARLYARDAAGNETEVVVKDFYVTTNLFVRYFNNKPLFYGSLCGLLALVGGTVYLILKKKKKEEAKV